MRQDGPMTYVVVGAGMAGGKAVETLRDEGFDGPVTLIGAEPDRPYERPPLSKGLLLGTDQLDSVFMHAPEWYQEHDVTLRTNTTVTAIERAEKLVRLSDGSEIAYEKLLLTTGSTPRPLPVPGGDRALTLRDLASLADKQLEMRDDARSLVAEEKARALAELTGELKAPLEPARQIAEQRAADATLPADVRADFQRVVESIARQEGIVDTLAGKG